HPVYRLVQAIQLRVPLTLSVFREMQYELQLGVANLKRASPIAFKGRRSRRRYAFSRYAAGRLARCRNTCCYADKTRRPNHGFSCASQLLCLVSLGKTIHIDVQRRLLGWQNWVSRSLKSKRHASACRLQNLSHCQLRLLLRVPIGVRRRKRLPLFRQILHREDRGYWANRYARAAVNAFRWVDIQLGHPFVFRFVLARVDTVHRAHVHAGGVLGADARLGNHISHSTSPYFRRWPPSAAKLQQNLRLQGRCNEPQSC